MRLRQEQLVFLGTLVVLGTMALGFEGGARARRGTPRGGEPPAAEHQRIPDLARVLPDDSRLQAERELFVPPSDTRPLPPLALEDPPLAELPALLPPTEPGPLPRAFGALLRVEAPARDALERAELAFDDAQRDEPELESQLEPGDRDPLASSGGRGGRAPLLTPAQELARQDAWRARYDWVLRRSGTTAYGRIVNEERFGLTLDPSRAEEPLRFVQVDPETGREVYASVGAPAIALARADVQAFGFAATATNEIELARRRLGPSIQASTMDEALALAERCIALRLEAPAALRTAEELYRACSAFDPEALEPRRGLARAFVAGFAFDDALRTYEALAAEHPDDVQTQVGLAGIEERFLLEREAEERLRRATRAAAESWRARFALGRFLLARGRAEEALAALERAASEVPQDPEALDLRVAVRTELGTAYLALGQRDEAARVFAQALAADAAHERALAGLRATRLLGATVEPPPTEPAEGAARAGGSGFELTLVAGIEALVGGRATESLELLRAASEVDPLRAQRALGALSFLAEKNGYPEEALRFVQDALEHTPDDPWSLYQRGRLLLRRDDLEGARESFHAALAHEPAFVDALVGTAEAAFRLGAFEDAERYLARALELEDERPAVLDLRGWNALHRGAREEARAAFERSLALDAEDPAARAGLAWCLYLEGDPEEARVALAELDRARRSLPDDDPSRQWARRQIERIADHEEKVEWFDDFERRELRNGWTAREGFGPLVSLAGGEVRIEGVCSETGRTSVFREYPAGSFVSFAVDVWIDAATSVKVGLFVARERQRRDANDTLGEVSLARHQDGALELAFVRKGLEPETVELPEPFPVGRWVRLSVVRDGEGSEARVSLFMDGIALIEDAPFAALGRAASPLQAGVFVDGLPGRRVSLRLDDAAVVYRP